MGIPVEYAMTLFVSIGSIDDIGNLALYLLSGISRNLINFCHPIVNYQIHDETLKLPIKENNDNDIISFISFLIIIFYNYL